jgi:hydroxyacylglutathione hydrolase
MGQKVEFENTMSNENYPGVKDVMPQDVLTQKNSLCLIDVRRPDEFEGELGHIAGSELLTLDFLPQKISELPADQTIVFICRSGNRSGQAAQFAQENGLKDVYNMKGGMLLWNELNLETEGKS